jgi:hypothetical protein
MTPLVMRISRPLALLARAVVTLAGVFVALVPLAAPVAGCLALLVERVAIAEEGPFAGLGGGGKPGQSQSESNDKSFAHCDISCG